MDQKMTIIITMAGLGTRFKKAGYTCPKYMIEAKGKTLFEWSMDSLADYWDHAGRTIFIVRREDNARDFIQSKCQKLGIVSASVIEIDHMTDGQATTAMLAVPACDPASPIMIYNIDTYVESFAMKYADISGDGHIPCFHAEGDHWSFVRLDETEKVVEIREKKRISDNCTLGAYYFSSARLFQQLYDEYYVQNNMVESGEKYIAPLYNFMIGKGMTVTISIVDDKRVHVLGTPEELDAFINESR